MKKLITIMLAAAFVLSALTGCNFFLGEKAEPIALPKTEEVTYLIIEKSGGIPKTCEDKEVINKVMSIIAEAEPTRKPTLNDTPATAEYIKIDVKCGETLADGGEKITRLFFYSENGKSYIEQPYGGVYELNESIEEMIGA